MCVLTRSTTGATLVFGPRARADDQDLFMMFRMVLQLLFAKNLPKILDFLARDSTILSTDACDHFDAFARSWSSFQTFLTQE